MIRRFFASGDVPEILSIYKPLFAYFDDEIKKTDLVNDKNENGSRIENDKKLIPKNKRYIIWLSGAAACAALLVSILYLNPQSKKCPTEGDYVFIDGRCYTDAETIRSATLNTLRDMSDDEDYFFDNNNIPEDNTSKGTKNIINHQLKEFGFIFDE